MKTIDPEEKITLTLPAHTLITLFHFCNGTDGAIDAFKKKFDRTRTPLFYNGEKGWATYRIIKEILSDHYGVNNISSLSYEDTVKLRLNDECEAEVIGDKIKVGCQEFEIDKLRELMKKIDEAKE